MLLLARRLRIHHLNLDYFIPTIAIIIITLIIIDDLDLSLSLKSLIY